MLEVHRIMKDGGGQSKPVILSLPETLAEAIYTLTEQEVYEYFRKGLELDLLVKERAKWKQERQSPPVAFTEEAELLGDRWDGLS